MLSSLCGIVRLAECELNLLAGNKGVLRQEELQAVKSGCILCNMGHPNMEIDVVRISLVHLLLITNRSLIHRLYIPGGLKK